MLRKLYDWTLQKAASPAAEYWLALIAFVESSVFLVPADVLFAPMALAVPKKAYRYALIATLASTAGGVAGYYIGHFAYTEIAKPILALYGKLEGFEQLRSSASKDAILLMLVTSGLAHLPPIKVLPFCPVLPASMCGFSSRLALLREALGSSLWLGHSRGTVSRSVDSSSDD